jgi:uncharacterized protein YbaR (Trm112 family)
MQKTSVRISFGGKPGSPTSAGTGGRRRLPGIPGFLIVAAFLVAGIILAATFVVALAVLVGVGLLIGIVWALVGKTKRGDSPGGGSVHRHPDAVEEKIACPACGLVFDLSPAAFASGSIACPSCHTPVSVHGSVPERH